MLQRLVPQGKPAAAAMEEIGFSAFDAQGKFVGLASVAQQLQDGLKGLTDKQRQAALTTIFGSDAVRAATVLYQLGASGVRDYVSAVNDQGAAQRVAAQQLDNLSGDVEVFRGSVETALIRLGDIGDGPLRDIVQGATDVVNAFDEFATSKAWEEINRRFSQLAQSATGLDKIGDGISGLLGNIDVADIDRFFDTVGRGVDKIRDFTGEFHALTDASAGLGVSIGLMGARSLPILGSFVPALSPVTAVLGGLLVGTDGGRKGLESLSDSFQKVAKGSGPQVAEALGKVADVAGDTLGSVLTDLAPVLADAANELLPMLAQDLEDIAPAAAEFLKSLAELAAHALPAVVDLFEDVEPVLRLVGPALHIAADAVGVLAHNAEILVPPLAAIVGYLKVKSLLNGAGLIGGLSKAVSGFATAAGEQGLGGALGTAAAGGASKLATSLGVLATPLGAAGLAAGAAAVTYTELSGAFDRARESGRRAANEFASQNPIQLDSQAHIDEGVKKYQEKIAALGADMARAINPFKDSKLHDQIAELTDLAGEALKTSHDAAVLSHELGINQDMALHVVAAQKALGDRFGTNAALADEFRSALSSLRTTGQDVADATDSVEEAVDNLTDTLKLNGNSFDATTEAGRSNREALSQLSDKAKDLAASMIEQSGDIEGARQKMLDYVEGLKTTLRQAGLTDDQIQQLLTTYGLTPDNIETVIKQLGAEQTTAKIEELRKKARETTDPIYWAKIDTLLNQGDLDAAAAAIDAAAADRTAHIRVKFDGFDNIPPGLLHDLYGKADGGIIDYYASGGVREDHVAQIAPAGSWRVWAEPETGGEAYIPLAPSKRPRSQMIWKETGKRLGMMFADGGHALPSMTAGPASEVTSLVAAIAGGAGPQVTIDTLNVSVNAGGDTDPDAIVRAIAGGLGKQLADVVRSEFAQTAKSEGPFLTKIGAAG
jgi:hypothetical protein